MADWSAKAERLKQEQPDISPVRINELLGPYPWDPPPGPGSPFRPAGLCESMLRRVVPTTLTGVLFYQGEEDSWRTEHYDQLLKAFIDQLRRQFIDPELPFLFVQLPMWIAAGAEDSKTWPRLRQAQQLVALGVRMTDMTVLIDQGEYNNIHPTNKKVVGERLFYSALRTIYSQDAPLSSRAISKYTQGNCLYVTLSKPVLPPVTEDLLLEVAGEDGRFHPAQAALDGHTLRLWSNSVPRPVQARYAWTDYAKVPYFDEDGLPLAPFLLE